MTFLARYEIQVKATIDGKEILLQLHEEDGIILPRLKGESFYLSKIGGLYFRGLLLLRDSPLVFPDMYLELVQVTPVSVIAPKTLRRCINCQLFDRGEGVRLLSDPTHQYHNKSYSQYEEIQRALSKDCKSAPITRTNAGFCPKRGGSLLTESSYICGDYKSRGLLAAIFNWIRLAFR